MTKTCGSAAAVKWKKKVAKYYWKFRVSAAQFRQSLADTVSMGKIAYDKWNFENLNLTKIKAKVCKSNVWRRENRLKYKSSLALSFESLAFKQSCQKSKRLWQLRYFFNNTLSKLKAWNNKSINIFLFWKYLKKIFFYFKAIPNKCIALHCLEKKTIE